MTTKVRLLFPGRQNVHRPIFFDIVNFSFELMVGKIEGLFSVLVVWSVSYARGAWSARGASNHSLAFMG